MAKRFYTCEQTGCGFIFERYGEVTACPRCGGKELRPATPEEEKRCLEQLRQLHGKL